MTRLLLGALLLGGIGACVAAHVPEVLAPPKHVKFESVDYKNVLHWTPPSNCSSLHYYVQWKIYGEPQWLDVDGCQGIQKHKCDLSAVTSDPRERYYGRVSAACLTSSKSVWALSRRFNPRGDTIISPPELRLNVTEDAVVVHVKPPRPLVRKLHHRLLYSIYLIDSSGKEEAFELSCCSDKLTLNHLEASGRYCLQAQILVPLQARSSARSAKTCVALL
ncbi:interleukin-22 receptor subunit alpha-2 isoform X2 [Betta splendens]|uniref:Interleukin-22 receptor subunit alpha-2 isoform X2 n=1 Tax=Betta splendens TaxID=158456 RepID=A0A6P7KMA0_BETSP|nr:interleukin-22 receptor subunit alpha-2 isoform X2 [Betta splendens]